MSRDELANIGVEYPIKLEYYKTQTNEEEVKSQKDIKYGVEVIKTAYINEKVDIEKRTIPEILRDEMKINRILDKLKENKVTPVSVEYVIEDLLKESC